MIPRRQWAYSLLANFPLEIGLKLAKIIDEEIPREAMWCSCGQQAA